MFVNFPRWGDPVDYTVAEIVGGRTVPYPGADVNRLDTTRLAGTFVSVQNVVVDLRDRLWILDTGSVEMGPVEYGGPKLVGVDLVTNQIVKRILFPPDVALPATYLNDVRFDLRRGSEGLAFITDSAPKGPNGIIVVDLASGRSWRKLHDHPSTRAVPDFLPFVEGRPIVERRPGQPPGRLTVGFDGIAISADGTRPFYCPLASRRLYSVAVDALADESLAPEAVAATVVDHGEKGASDGLESDAAGTLYLTDYEHNAIHRRLPDGTIEALLSDERLVWADTLAVAADGYLYVTANQLHRQPQFWNGVDYRERPYYLFRTYLGATPVRLR